MLFSVIGNNILKGLLHLRSDTSASWVGTHNLIDPTGLDITFTRCLDESYETVPTYDVQAKLGQLTVSRVIDWSRS